jgi:hypothetical protein
MAWRVFFWLRLVARRNSTQRAHIQRKIEHAQPAATLYRIAQ